MLSGIIDLGDNLSYNDDTDRNEVRTMQTKIVSGPYPPDTPQMILGHRAKLRSGVEFVRRSQEEDQ